MFDAYDENADDKADGRELCRHSAPTSTSFLLTYSTKLIYKVEYVLGVAAILQQKHFVSQTSIQRTGTKLVETLLENNSITRKVIIKRNHSLRK